MTPQRNALLLHHMPDPGQFNGGEAVLLPALVRWLVATGRVRAQTRIAREVPWLGRRVDLALLTGRGVATAFELKIGRLQRVIEQATYNQASFHRSWVVTGNRPRSEGLQWAIQLGVGLLVVQQDKVIALVAPAVQVPDPAAAKRLRVAIKSRSGAPAA